MSAENLLDWQALSKPPEVIRRDIGEITIIDTTDERWVMSSNIDMYRVLYSLNEHDTLKGVNAVRIIETKENFYVTSELFVPIIPLGFTEEEVRSYLLRLGEVLAQKGDQCAFVNMYDELNFSSQRRKYG